VLSEIGHIVRPMLVAATLSFPAWTIGFCLPGTLDSWRSQ
jgi:hypothetical protein